MKNMQNKTPTTLSTKASLRVCVCVCVCVSLSLFLVLNFFYKKFPFLPFEQFNSSGCSVVGELCAGE